MSRRSNDGRRPPSSGSAPEVLYHPAAPSPSGGEGAPESPTQGGIAEFTVLVRRLMGELRRQWWVAVGVFALVMVPATLFAALSVPRFTSTGLVQVAAGDAMAASPLSDLMGGMNLADVDTEVQLLRRRGFVIRSGRAVGLHLARREDEDRKVTLDLDVAQGRASPVPERLRALRLVANDSYVSDGVLEPVTVTFVQREGQVFVRLENASPADHPLIVNEPLEIGGAVLEISALPWKTDGELTVEVLPDGELANQIMGSYRAYPISGGVKNTNIVTVSFTHVDRRTAASMVDEVMAAYLDETLDWQAQGASRAARFIADRLDTAGEKLERAENALRAFSEEHGAVLVDEQVRATIEKTAELEANEMLVQLRNGALESLASSLASKAGKPGTGVEIAGDVILTSSVGALMESESRLSMLRATLSESHPHVVSLKAQVAESRRDLRGQVRAAIRANEARRSEIQEELEEASKALSGYPELQLQIARLQREVLVQERVYSFLLEKYQDAEILEASTTIDKRIVDPASFPIYRSAPGRAKIIVGSFLVGVMMAVGAVLLVGTFRIRLGSLEEVRGLTGLPLYGLIPMIRTSKDQDGSSGDRLSPADVWKEGSSLVAEAFRSLFVSISLLPLGSKGRTVMVSSSSEKEGKSTVLSNMAVAAARAGARVVVVDLDLRRPVLHRVLGGHRSPGVVEYCSGGAKGLKPRMVDTPGGQVAFLPAGTQVPDSAGVIMSAQLEDIIEELREDFDYVFIDAPPAFVPDTPAIARLADVVLLVVRIGVAGKTGLLHAVRALTVDSAGLGMVVNGVEPQHSDAYYGGNYYYAQTYAAESNDGAEVEAERGIG